MSRFGEDYGKFESGNKLSFGDLARYIETKAPETKFSFFEDVYPQMKAIARHSMLASFGKIDPNKRESSFEIFGLDFMIEESGRVFLIEINENPCLELSSPLLGRIIPHMLDNAFRFNFFLQ